jgi:hypothetical protein
MDASIQSQGCECSQYGDAKSSTCELLKQPSMALDSSIPDGITICVDTYAFKGLAVVNLG